MAGSLTGLPREQQRGMYRGWRASSSLPRRYSAVVHLVPLCAREGEPFGRRPSRRGAGRRSAVISKPAVAPFGATLAIVPSMNEPSQRAKTQPHRGEEGAGCCRAPPRGVRAEEAELEQLIAQDPGGTWHRGESAQGVPVGRVTLHEAMTHVLRQHGGKGMTARQIADEVQWGGVSETDGSSWSRTRSTPGSIATTSCSRTAR